MAERRGPSASLPALALLFLFIGTELTSAQYSLGPLTMTGSVGFSSEAYTASGIAARRPPASARLFANASASAFGMSYGLQANLTTEGSEFRQSMSQIGLDVSYEWIHVTLGDVRPSLSRFSVEGISLRGALVELTPGSLLFSAAAGQSQRAVQPDSTDPYRKPAYDRSLYAVKMGYGSLSEWFVHLIGVYAHDDRSSLPPGTDVAPQENFNASTSFGSKLLENRLSLEGTVTLSTLSEDTRLPEIDRTTTPVIFSPFIKERGGNRTDYAARINAQYSEKGYGVQTFYERIQPGFASLGLATTRSDQESFGIRPHATFLDQHARVTLDFSQSRNNLLNNLASTSTRRNFGVLSMLRISKEMSLNASYRLLTYEINPRNGGSAIPLDQTSHAVTLVPTLSWVSDRTSHTASLTTSIQTSSVERGGPLPQSSGTSTVTNSALYTISYPSGLNLHTTANVLLSDAGPTENTSFGVSAGAGYPFFERALVAGLVLGVTENRSTTSAGGSTNATSTTQWVLNVNAAYRLWFGDVLRFTMRALSSRAGGGRSFRELQANLELTRQL
ncbi:MAG: hypothetical protein HBSIN02_13540 [Bacteroidia bacterium]|nr:MAG: hypothetical protein HBSIN02_13540 [Bacteroidia bacterium]